MKSLCIKELFCEGEENPELDCSHLTEIIVESEEKCPENSRPCNTFALVDVHCVPISAWYESIIILNSTLKIIGNLILLNPFRCNGTRECLRGEDEDDVTCSKPCGKNQIRCMNGIGCILKT